jgi:hypothetical protein
MIGDAVVDWLASVLESGHICLLDRAEGVVSSCRPGVDSPDLLPSCKACTSKEGVAEPLYLALIASRRFRRCSIRAASSRGSSSGGSIAGASAFLLVLRRC